MFSCDIILTKMKRRLFATCLLVITFITASTQPKSIHYKKENNFFMNVIYNPSFSLYNFLVVGLSSKNTELKDLHVYVNSKNVQDQCRTLNISISETYNKVKASWNIFLEVENTDLSVYGFGKYMMEYSPYNLFAPRTCPNPELKHKLSIVPLKLKEY